MSSSLATLCLAQGGNIGEGPGWGPFFLVVLAATTLVFVISASIGLVLVRSASRYPRSLGGPIGWSIPVGAVVSVLGGFVSLMAESLMVGVIVLIFGAIAYVWWFASRWQKPPRS